MKVIQLNLVSVVCIGFIILSTTIAAPYERKKSDGIVKKTFDKVKGCFVGYKSSSCNEAPKTHGHPDHMSNSEPYTKAINAEITDEAGPNVDQHGADLKSEDLNQCGINHSSGATFAGQSHDQFGVNDHYHSNSIDTYPEFLDKERAKEKLDTTRFMSEYIASFPNLNAFLDGNRNTP